MLKGISTHIFRKQRLSGATLDALAAGGAEAIEIFASRQHFDYTSRQHVVEISQWFSAGSAAAWALHAPIFSDSDGGRGGEPAVNVVHADKSRRIDAMDEVKRALESAELIPFRHMVLHLGERGDGWNPRTLEHAMTAVEHLRAFARPLGVQILLENLDANEVARPKNLMDILTIGHFDDIGVCLDLGHAHLGEGIVDSIAILGERIRSCHVHDNHGDRDAHLWPGEGTIDWQATLESLNRLKQPPAAVLEISAAGGEQGSQLTQKFRETFERMDRDSAELRK